MKQKKELPSPLHRDRNLHQAARACAVLLMVGALCITPAFADNQVITVINNLSEFIFGLIRAIGLILLGLGVLQIGMALKSHDPSQRANVRPDRVLFQ